MEKAVKLVLDTYHTDSDNVVTFALNAQLENQHGDQLHYQNEVGTTYITEVPSEVWGQVNMERGESCIFSGQGEIGVLSSGVYTKLYDNSELAFNSYIKGEYRLLNGCDRIVYWNDGVNPDRVINLDKISLIQSIDELRQQSLVQQPVVSSLQLVNSGGILKLGSYSFAAQLLDENLNVVSTSEVSTQIDTDEPGFNLATFIEGYSAEEGGKNPLAKSIRVTIENVDTNYPYLRLFAIASVETVGTSVYEVSNLIPTQSTVNFTFTGINGTTRTDIERLLVDPVVYETSQAMQVVDKRLVKANLTSKFYDYSGLQRYTNDSVTLNWVAEEITETQRSFQSDEIYAFGIQFQYSDFAWSPVFHIPGREADAADLFERTYTIDEVGEGNSLVQPSWKMYSTAKNLTSTTGLFGYYQTDQVYPSIKDCNGEFVYGSLAGKNVRYHRFPSKANLSQSTRLGVQVNIGTLPTGTIGYRIVFTPRDDFNRTVNEGGVAFTRDRIEDGVYEYNTYANNLVSADYLATMTPSELGGSGVRSDYISRVKGINLSNPVITSTVYDIRDSNRFDLKVQVNDYTSTYVTSPERYFSVEESFYLNCKETFDNNFNRSFNTDSLSVLKCNYQSTAGKFNYILKKQRVNPYQDIFSLRYKLLNSLVQYSATATYFEGDVYSTSFNLFNCEEVTVGATGGNNNDLDILFNHHYFKFWIESEINYSLRVNGLDERSVYQYGDLVEYATERITDIDGGEAVWEAGNSALGIFRIIIPLLSLSDAQTIASMREQVKEITIPDYYNYNSDYSLTYLSKWFTGLPITYNYCNRCGNKFPNRIIWSNVSFTEELRDNWRIYLSENFTSVGTSPITALHYDKNRLIVRSTKTLHSLTPNPQQISSDAGAIYLGTGDFLSIPPTQMINVDYGFGGGSGRMDHVKTEYGWCTVDQQTGQVFLFSEGYNELTGIDVQQWFKTNLPISSTGEIHCGYDPRFKRLLIWKKDYEKITDTTSTDVSNKDNYRDKSILISYSLQYQSWISLHSWKPRLFWSDYNGLYSTNGKKIYRHDSTQYGDFYGTTHKWGIELPVFDYGNKDLEVVEYYAHSFIGNRNVDYPTFNEVIVYTNAQSTGIQTLAPKGIYPSDWTTKTVTRHNNFYRISDLRSLSTSDNVFSEEWVDVKNDYYIDKIPVNINYNLNQYDQIPITDTYFYVRLMYDNKVNVKLVFDVINTVTRIKQG